MSSNKQFSKKQRWSMCGKKHRYASEYAAIHTLLKCSRAGGQPLRYYYCPICKGWHITHIIEQEKEDE